MFTRFVAAKRCIHSANNFFCKFKFSDVETEKILSVVNSSSVEYLTDRFGISNTTARKLQIVRQRASKNVDSIAALLSSGGFTENGLNKFCKQILNEGGEGVDGKIKKPKLRLLTTPPIPVNVISQINSFTSIQCGLVGFSWCTFEITPQKMTKITHWDFRPSPETKLTLHQLGAFISSTLKAVPQSDFYVFEDPTIFKGGPTSKVNLNVQLAHMIGMASVSLAQRSAISVVDDEIDPAPTMNNVAYLKKFLFARLFKLYIGKERVSSTDCVEDIIRPSNISGVMLQDNVQTLVELDDDIRQRYFASDSHVKDFLSCSLLMGLAFLRLNILKCPESLQLVA